MDQNTLRIDQSLEALQRCYTYSGEPAEVDDRLYADKSLDWKMLHYGQCARSRIFCKGIFPELIQFGTPDTIPVFQSHAALVEFFWFLFGQKAWNKLYAMFTATAPETLAALPVEVADLYMLTCLRLNRKDYITEEGSAALFRRLDRACAEIARIWPQDTARKAYFDAIRAHVGGDIAGARRIFVDVPQDIRLAGPLRAVGSVLPRPKPHAVSENGLEILSMSSARNVILISLDKNYYDTYFEKFLVSLTAQQATWGLHLHCIGFTPDLRGMETGGISLGVTVDRTEIASKSVEWNAAYSACARYLYAATYLRIYSQILICDVDGQITPRLHDIDRLHPDADVLMFATLFFSPEKRANPLPWNAVSASDMVLRASPGGAAFAGGVGSYLDTVFAQGAFHSAPWFADQNALFYCYVDFLEEVVFARLHARVFTQAMDWRQFFGTTSKKGLT